jgi:hypothetical protein
MSDQTQQAAGKAALALMMVTELPPYVGFLWMAFRAWKAWAASWLVVRLAMTALGALGGLLLGMVVIHVLMGALALVVAVVTRGGTSGRK